MDVCFPLGTDWSGYKGEGASDPAKRELAEAYAWYTLASLTAYRIGVCPDVVRPCASRCNPAGTWLVAPVLGGDTAGLPVRTIGSFTPHLRGGVWYNSCGCSWDSCGCGVVSTVVLPGPVGGIDYVKIDGEIIEPSTYRVDNGNELISLDPARPWPIRQDILAGEDEVGSFVVSYYRGAEPNDLTRSAAGLLAVEYMKALDNDTKCRLPKGTQQVVRGGTTINIATDVFADGTGIREVDDVIRLYNPYKLRSAPRVLTPSRNTPRRTTWMA